jgi:hypothetical protein
MAHPLIIELFTNDQVKDTVASLAADPFCTMHYWKKYSQDGTFFLA